MRPGRPGATFGGAVRTYRLDASIRLDAPVGEVFDFFSRAGNLEALTPPWIGFSILSPTPIAMEEGARIDYRLRIRGVPVTWRTRIAVWDPPRRFVDVQESGPYRMWHHVHAFEPDGDGTIARDRVTYAVPGGALVHRLLVRRDVLAIFRFRHSKLASTFGSSDDPDPTIERIA